MYMHGNETEHAAARLMSMVSVVTFVVLWWLKKKQHKKSPATQDLLLKPMLAACGLSWKQNNISDFTDIVTMPL